MRLKGMKSQTVSLTFLKKLRSFIKMLSPLVSLEAIFKKPHTIVTSTLIFFSLAGGIDLLSGDLGGLSVSELPYSLK